MREYIGEYLVKDPRFIGCLKVSWYQLQRALSPFLSHCVLGRIDLIVSNFGTDFDSVPPDKVLAALAGIIYSNFRKSTDGNMDLDVLLFNPRDNSSYSKSKFLFHAWLIRHSDYAEIVLELQKPGRQPQFSFSFEL